MRLIVFIALLLIPILVSAQSRGPNPGEIYLSTTWYYTDIEQYDMIIYSDNYGKTFEPLYVYLHNFDEIPIGIVYADAAPNVLYNRTAQGLYISFNNGLTWSYKETPGSLGRYTTGSFPGEIYKCCASDEGYIYFSDDFGDSFSIINDSSYLPLEVGTNQSELYAKSVNDYGRYNLFHSTNNGHTFENLYLDSVIGGTDRTNYFPSMSRGTDSGELYWISWHLPSNFRIYRSSDYGNSFTLQYEQKDTADGFSEGYYFTAGCESGEFYIIKNIPWYDGENTKMQVYYSSDYAKTFTEYVHIFDKNWTGIEENLNLEEKNHVLCYPNPFSAETTIILPEELNLNFAEIIIYNAVGQIVEVIENLNTHTFLYSPEDDLKGVYYYSLFYQNKMIETNKMVILE